MIGKYEKHHMEYSFDRFGQLTVKGAQPICSHCGRAPHRAGGVIVDFSRTGFFWWWPRFILYRPADVDRDWTKVQLMKTDQKTGSIDRPVFYFDTPECHRLWDANQAAIETIADTVRGEMSWVYASR